MNRRFDRATAKLYTFHDDHDERELIALYIGGQRAGFIELDAAHRLADRLHDLCRESEQKRDADG